MITTTTKAMTSSTTTTIQRSNGYIIHPLIDQYQHPPVPFPRHHDQHRLFHPTCNGEVKVPLSLQLKGGAPNGLVHHNCVPPERSAGMARKSGMGLGDGTEKAEDLQHPTPAVILRSAIPCLIFFFVYGINGQLRIVPRASDAHCVTLHNVSSLERYVFTFSPHRLVSDAHHPVLDLLSAVPYLLHYLIPIAYPAWLYRVGRTFVVPSFYRLLAGAMWAHYVVWIFLPTAPPWVFDNIEHYRAEGVTPPPMVLQPREGCAFARLDKLTGVPLFNSIFTGNPVPFAAFPSGHVAWPMCILLTLPTFGVYRKLFVVYIMWVAWATMYTCHHYLIDILAAVCLVLLTDWIVAWFEGRVTVRRKEWLARESRLRRGSADDVNCSGTLFKFTLA